jgi:uncharacterized cupin superfamily protein
LVTSKYKAEAWLPREAAHDRVRELLMSDSGVQRCVTRVIGTYGLLHESYVHKRNIWFNRKRGLRARMPDATVHVVPATTAATSGERGGCTRVRPSSSRVIASMPRVLRASFSQPSRSGSPAGSRECARRMYRSQPNRLELCELMSGVHAHTHTGTVPVHVRTGGGTGTDRYR